MGDVPRIKDNSSFQKALKLFEISRVAKVWIKITQVYPSIYSIAKGKNV